MEHPKELLQKLEKLEGLFGAYAPEAYSFVLRALDFTVAKLLKARHVSGKELLGGIREYGIKEFGPMALSVFEHWGVRSTLDFGQIVFNLVESGLLRKRDEDVIDDFKSVYDFKDAFSVKFEFQDET